MQNFQEETDPEEAKFSSLSEERVKFIDQDLLELGLEISDWRRENSQTNF